MTKVKRSWIAVVMSALLLGTLVGAVWARPHDRPQSADITRKVSLGASDFIPLDEGYNYYNYGDRLICQASNCRFTAPVVFPCLPSVTVERIKLHVKDSNSGAFAKATLYRHHLSTGGQANLGEAESMDGGYQPWSSDPINKTVWPSQRAYIYLYIGGTNIQVGGVTVEYHRNI